MKLTFELEETTISDIQSNLDPFAELFDIVSLKICWILFSIAIHMFSNPYYCLIIWYEKYGEDWMKRSLYNQLIGQVSYPIILHNLVCVPPLCKPSWSAILTCVTYRANSNKTVNLKSKTVLFR